MADGVKQSVVVLGTGKTARDLGLFFWQKGYAVTWVGSDAGRLAALEAQMSKRIRRLARTLGNDAAGGNVAFGTASEDLPCDLDIVVECGREDVAFKRAALAALSTSVSGRTLVLSNSSSILPETIGSGVVGMHFFYPLALTAFAEVVFPEGCSGRTRERVMDLARSWGIEIAVQSSKNAFALNRLLLPLQAEMLRQFLVGHPLAVLDTVTASDLLAMGQVRMMNDIGLDVLAASVRNYVGRMAPEVAADYRPLCERLTALVNAGFLGKKNRRDLFDAEKEALPALVEGRRESGAHGREARTGLRHVFRTLLINTGLTLTETGESDQDTLSRFTTVVLGADITLADAVERPEASGLREDLAARFAETDISYFRPSGLLG